MGVAAYSWATRRHGDERIPAIVIESFFHQQQNPSQCSNNIWLIIYNYKHFNFEYPQFTTHFQIQTASWSHLFTSTVQSFQACSITEEWSPCKDPLSLLHNYEWETDSSNATQLTYTWHNLGQRNMTMTMTIIIIQTQTMNQTMYSKPLLQLRSCQCQTLQFSLVPRPFNSMWSRCSQQVGSPASRWKSHKPSNSMPLSALNLVESARRGSMTMTWHSVESARIRRSMTMTWLDTHKQRLKE